VLAAGSVGAYLHRQFQRLKVARLRRFMERPVIEYGKWELASLDIPHLDDWHGDAGNDNVEVADELRVVGGLAAEVVDDSRIQERSQARESRPPSDGLLL
jgi:hypothetical protein